MLKKRTFLASAALAAASAPLARVARAAEEKRVFYWISHGSPADPVWTYFLAGARIWARDTGQTVKTSFYSGDVPSQQEAVRDAIAARASGIVTTSPDPGSMVKVVAEAKAASIPIINFNTPDPAAHFPAYVGGNNVVFGHNWAQYLVDHHLIKPGAFVWLPVEVLGATYGVQEEQGIASVLKPFGATWHVTGNTLDQATIISRMVDYITANRKKINAIIGLGDLVMGSIKRVFDQANVAKGSIPVIGWGDSLYTVDEVEQGYVNAAQWQDPQATSYMALSLADMAASGVPPGFDILTGRLYDASSAGVYKKTLSSKQ